MGAFQPGPQPQVNGAGALDLAAMKAAANAQEQIEAERDKLTAQLLRQAQLICGCGEPLPRDPVFYFRAESGPVQTPAGVQLGMNLAIHPCCSTGCSSALELQQTAAARRRGQTGQIVLLDAGRAALAAEHE